MRARPSRLFRTKARSNGPTPAERLDALDVWRQSVDLWLAALDDQGTVLHRAADMIIKRIERLERHDTLRTFTSWIEAVTLGSAPLVSVIMPTRDRAALLPRAIGSLQDQAYSRWELVVVDDGSVDDTQAVLGAMDDERIRVVQGSASGASAARNLGLEHAGGDLIAYLDDDNVMDPLWLKAVVWAFEQRPDVIVAYGGIMIDDTARAHGVPGWEPPSLWLEPYDRDGAVVANVADTGGIAHRASIGARFDETLRTLGDWDFFLTATTDADPLMVPAVACRYFSDGPNRLSGGPHRNESEADRVRRKHQHLRAR